MRKAMTSLVAITAAALLLATIAGAEPGKPEHAGKPERAGKAEHAGKAEPAGKSEQAGKAAPDRAKEKRDKSPEDRADRGKSAEAHAEAPGQGGEARGEGLGQTREKRRKEHRDRLHAQHGADLMQRPPVLAELKTHAWRMARLERLRALAEADTNAAKRKKTLERLDKLTTREKARHDRQMEQLKSQGDQGSEKRAEKAGGAQ